MKRNWLCQPWAKVMLNWCDSPTEKGGTWCMKKFLTSCRHKGFKNVGQKSSLSSHDMTSLCTFSKLPPICSHKFSLRQTPIHQPLFRERFYPVLIRTFFTESSGILNVNRNRPIPGASPFVISPDFSLELTGFFPGKHLIHFLVLKMKDFRNFVLDFDAEQVYLKLQVTNLKNKEVTVNPKPQTLEKNCIFENPIP